jgi:hypothetical protein
MPFVPLDRRFNRWTEEDRHDIDTLRLLGFGRFGLGWSDLLKAKRVVVLAEGGSGKSTEFRAQHERLINQGEFSFLATVEKVGKHDFDSTLTRRDRDRLAEWRNSEKPAWFFVDSVDEAKLALVQFEDALNHIADSIDGAEGRAHMIISGRHADWEFKRDLSLLAKILPIHELASTPLASPNELVTLAMRRHKVAITPVEQPLVLLMSSLGAAQVEKFAIGRGVSDAQAFLDDIEKARLWRFASRPADLDWLVEYWNKNRAFSDLEPMLALNLQARFMETSRQRIGQTSLDSNLAMRALDRVGAALVFGKRRDILIPDSDRTPGDDAAAASLAQVLPDLTQRQHLDLINSAIFVPAEPGLARLHNDNEGAVRSYLTARWLKRLGDNNCPWSQRSELLFATIYGVDVVKPSMRDTATWLALWDEAVAQEVLARDPMLLIESGDPASLPPHIRIKALGAAIQAWASRPHAGFINHESLRRFARPDIDASVKEHWQKWKDHEAIRHLLLMLIEAGHLNGCADIALSTATDFSADSLSQSLAVRALSAIGGPGSLQACRDFLLANRATLDHDTLWVAVDELFPDSLSVADLVLLMDDLTRKESAHSSGIDFYGSKLAERINEPGDALALLSRLMAMASMNPAQIPSSEFERVEARLNTMRALAIRILNLQVPAPPREIFDLQLWLDELALTHPLNKTDEFDLGDRLSKAPRLRQAWFWSAVEKYETLPKATTSPLEASWQLSEFGYYPNFDESDTPWLLIDLRDRPVQRDRALALDALLMVWRARGQSADLLHKISEAVKGAPDLEAKMQVWLRPVESPPNLVKLNAQQQARRDAADQQRAEEERSWTALADSIRANPQQLKSLIAPSEDGIDRRMYFLWNVLRGRSEDVSSSAAPDLGSMKGVFDDEVIELFRAGLLAHWRSAPMPILRSKLPVESRHTFTMMDMMGLDGVALEALEDPRWAHKLTGDESIRAAIYATFSLNKLPRWLSDLCDAQPAACAHVLRECIAPDIADTTGSHRRDNLERLANSDRGVTKLIEHDVREFIERNSGLALEALSPALEILRAATDLRSTLFSLAIGRAKQATDPHLISEYLATAFFIDGDTATDTLVYVSDSLDADPARALASALIPKLFGNSWTPPTERMNNLSVGNLERLILFAFDRIPPSEDVDRANGKVYSPDERDHASGARQIAFNRLANMPGAAAYAALNRFIARKDFPHPVWHLTELARKRAESDSESAPWEASDIMAFEDNFQALPRTASDLQRVAMNRFADLEHDLIHSDFGQGEIFATLPYEVDVQRWVADHFRAGQGKGFSIEREPHSADEKEPDLRIEAKATDARLPIEIKVADSWSRSELEAALKVQLMGRYLRDRNNRWGILLLVYQQERPQGWEKPSGSGYWTFAEVVKHLRAIARGIAAKGSQEPQMQISVIDVSKVPRKPTKKSS